MKFSIFNFQFSKGFTLVEIMTAVSVFLIIMTISMGSILSVFDGNRRSRSIRTVMVNLNLAVESMSREMRFGRNYHCREAGDITLPQDCANGDDFISFLSSDDEQIVYRLSEGRIEKSLDGGDTYAAVTASTSAMFIEDLTFYTVGSSGSDDLQPKVLIKIDGYSGVNKSKSEFTLQTLVSQRALDN